MSNTETSKTAASDKEGGSITASTVRAEHRHGARSSLPGRPRRTSLHRHRRVAGVAMSLPAFVLVAL
ncbi:MAG TPA: hypothetical protein VFN80_04030, partial [Acidothermaceae bacterium]|nr:hypothetical protein [Acidothermaceae bacterium]